MQLRVCVLGRVISITLARSQLAIAINDVFFLPPTVHPSLSTTSPDIGQSKRSSRWAARAEPASPCKRPRKEIEDSGLVETDLAASHSVQPEHEDSESSDTRESSVTWESSLPTGGAGTYELRNHQGKK